MLADLLVLAAMVYCWTRPAMSDSIEIVRGATLVFWVAFSGSEETALHLVSGLISLKWLAGFALMAAAGEIKWSWRWHENQRSV